MIFHCYLIAYSDQLLDRFKSMAKTVLIFRGKALEFNKFYKVYYNLTNLLGKKFSCTVLTESN